MWTQSFTRRKFWDRVKEWNSKVVEVTNHCQLGIDELSGYKEQGTGGGDGDTDEELRVNYVLTHVTSSSGSLPPDNLKAAWPAIPELIKTCANFCLSLCSAHGGCERNYTWDMWFDMQWHYKLYYEEKLVFWDITWPIISMFFANIYHICLKWNI